MRASAASRISSPASVYAAREQTNTPKSDEASPFALLVDAAAGSAPKAANQKAANQSGADSKNDDQPDSDTSDQTAAPQPSAQNSSTQPQSAPASGNRQDEDTQVSADAAPAAHVPQTIDPAMLSAAVLPPAASQVAKAVHDDATSTDDTISGKDAVALWPQSVRPAPQATPARPIKTDKGVKKDVTEPAALPDPAATLAASTPSPDQQPAIPPAPMVPPPAPAPQVQAQADQLTVQPAAQPAATPVPVLPQDPLAPQPVAQQPAAQQPAQQAIDQVTGQTSDQTAGQATPSVSAAAVQAAAAPPVGTPDAAPPAQNKTAADKVAQTFDLASVKAQPQPDAAQADAKTETFKPAKASGKTPADSDPVIVKNADAPDADKVQQPDAPKPAASQAEAPAPKVSVDAITPPAAQPAAPQIQSPAITQHVQVTAHPREAAPNMPALAVEIAAKSQSGAKQFDIRLDPPELGRVEVRLSIDATGKASAHLSADQPQTLTLLQKDAHVLTRALRDAGLDVSQDGLNFSLRQQANQDGGAGAHSNNQAGRRSGRGFALSASTSLEAGATSAAYSSPANGHLDIRV